MMKVPSNPTFDYRVMDTTGLPTLDGAHSNYEHLFSPWFPRFATFIRWVQPRATMFDVSLPP